MTLEREIQLTSLSSLFGQTTKTFSIVFLLENYQDIKVYIICVRLYFVFVDLHNF